MRLSLEVLEDRIVPAQNIWDVAVRTDTNPNGGGVQLGNAVGDLRWCLNQVDKSNVGDTNTIVFLQGAQPLTGTITLQGKLPDITRNVTIAGKSGNYGNEITIQGSGNAANPYGIFTIDSGVTAEFDYITIEDGFVSGANAKGGGIYNMGTLTLKGCDVYDNQAVGGGSGGGIFNGGGAKLTLDYNSSVDVNSASDFGGGIYNLVTLAISCTFRENLTLMRPDAAYA